MSSLIDALEGIVPVEPESEAADNTSQPAVGIGEAQLTQEITTLWSDHVRLSADRKLTSKDLRQIKARLAERLYEMKALLSRPGRGGQWRGWLKDQKIPRSTADRLVARHAESLGVEDKNVPSEAPDPEKLAKEVWHRHGKALANEGDVIRFIACIAEASGVPYEVSADGLLILSAVSGASDGVEAPIDVRPAPQASCEASTSGGETADALPVVDQSAASEAGSEPDAQPIA